MVAYAPAEIQSRIHSSAMLPRPLQFPQIKMLPERTMLADDEMTITERRKYLKKMWPLATYLRHFDCFLQDARTRTTLHSNRQRHHRGPVAHPRDRARRRATHSAHGNGRKHQTLAGGGGPA